ncbi:hypothetical protein B0H16DRAFT_1468614 [Mycena metata]|uniref:Uncharacterized protein n=1 Tax=Mycena metata TaxID=1033252 RepID=A0AAD7I0J8_9AGAR|nr:hypothetical protein B0H16DRAFT_1468614 [Mycena metata]
MSTNGGCSRCAPGQCAGFASYSSVSCYCGHPDSDHGPPPPSLPPRGGYPASGCPRYIYSPHNVLRDRPGYTPCEHPGCARPYISHDPSAPTALILPPPTNLAMVPSRAAPAQSWGQSPLSGLGGDERHRVAAAHHRSWGPASGSSMPRGLHRPFSSNSRSQASAPAKKTASHKLSFILWPFPMPNQKHTDPDYPDLYPIDPRLCGEENSTLITTLNTFHLIFELLVPTPADGSDIKEYVFYADLNTALTEFMNTHNLSFSGVPAAPPTPPMPATGGLNAWHASCLLNYAWTTVTLGIKPKAGFKRKLSAAVTPWYDFKLAALRTKGSWSTIPDFVNPNSLLFMLAPKYGPVRGPIPPDFSPNATHLCLALHLQHSLQGFEGDLPIECHPDCSPVAPASSPANGANTHSILLSIPIDADLEDEHLRLALLNSLGGDSGPPPASSTPVAGPSHRPLPAPPIGSIRPRSISLSISPLPTAATFHAPSAESCHHRRSYPRLDPKPISRASHQRASPYVPNSYCWYQSSVRDMLTSTPATITAANTEAAVYALLKHIEDFYGGPGYTPEGVIDRVIIEPQGEFALLSQDVSWKWLVSGGSLGPGVGATIYEIGAACQNSDIQRDTAVGVFTAAEVEEFPGFCTTPLPPAGGHTPVLFRRLVHRAEERGKLGWSGRLLALATSEYQNVRYTAACRIRGEFRGGTRDGGGVKASGVGCPSRTMGKPQWE